MASGKALPTAALRAELEKHPAEYRTRPKPFRLATKNAKVAARAKFSAPPRPFQSSEHIKSFPRGRRYDLQPL